MKIFGTRVIGEQAMSTGIAVVLLMLIFGPAAHAQRWEYLGEANVDSAVDHDNIVVSRSRGMYRAIQIRVQKAPIEFDRVIVHYGRGEAEPIQIRSVIPAGGQTRVIDLPGERRMIQSVEFWYARAKPGSRRPKVRLFGLR
jgi:hypothetical protein